MPSEFLNALKAAFFGESLPSDTNVEQVQEPVVPVVSVVTEAPKQAIVTPADPSDLTRLPYSPTAVIIENVFRNLKKVDPKSNMALEARVGVTIWLLAFVDEHYPKTYAESMYPHMTLNDLETVCDIKPTGFNIKAVNGVHSNEFFHWLCLLGQNALTNPAIGFDGRVIIDDVNGSREPRWQSVKLEQANYKLNSRDAHDRLEQAQGHTKISDRWTLLEHTDLDNSFAFINELQVGNINFHLNTLLDWSGKWDEFKYKISDMLEEKKHQKIYDMLTSLDAVIPLSTWQLNKSLDMGTVMKNIWRHEGGSSYQRIDLTSEFASYYEARLQCCIALGKIDEANKMLDKLALLVRESKNTYSEEKASSSMCLGAYAKQLNRHEDELKFVKEAAKYILESHTRTGGESSYLIPAYIVAKLWQEGEIELKGTIYSLPLTEAFDIALQAYPDGSENPFFYCFNDAVEENRIKEIFGEVSLDEMRKAIKLAKNQLVFDAGQAGRHGDKKLSRTTSCSALLFKPEIPNRLAETTVGSAYQPVRLVG